MSGEGLVFHTTSDFNGTLDGETAGDYWVRNCFTDFGSSGARTAACNGATEGFGKFTKQVNHGLSRNEMARMCYQIQIVEPLNRGIVKPWNR